MPSDYRRALRSGRDALGHAKLSGSLKIHPGTSPDFQKKMMKEQNGERFTSE